MPKLPDCTAGDCDRDAFLLHKDQPYCAAHYDAIVCAQIEKAEGWVS